MIPRIQSTGYFKSVGLCQPTTIGTLQKSLEYVFVAHLNNHSKQKQFTILYCQKLDRVSLVGYFRLFVNLSLIKYYIIMSKGI